MNEPSENGLDTRFRYSCVAAFVLPSEPAYLATIHPLQEQYTLKTRFGTSGTNSVLVGWRVSLRRHKIKRATTSAARTAQPVPLRLCRSSTYSTHGARSSYELRDAIRVGILFGGAENSPSLFNWFPPALARIIGISGVHPTGRRDSCAAVLQRADADARRRLRRIRSGGFVRHSVLSTFRVN